MPCESELKDKNRHPLMQKSVKAGGVRGGVYSTESLLRIIHTSGFEVDVVNKTEFSDLMLQRHLPHNLRLSIKMKLTFLSCKPRKL